MDWAFFGILFALFGGATMVVSDIYKANGYLVSIWRSFSISLFAMPALFFVNVPNDFDFWWQVILQGILTGYFSSRVYASSAKFGGGATSRILVFQVIFSLIIWWGIDIKSFVDLFDKPLYFIGTILGISGSIFGYFKISKGTISKELLRYMILAVIASSLMSVNRKNMIGVDGFLVGDVVYLSISLLISGFYNVIVFTIKERVSLKKLYSDLLQTNTVKAGLLVGFFSALTIISGNISIGLVPNPAYVNAITLSTPIAISVFNKFTHRAVEFNVVGMLITLFSLCVVIFCSGVN